MKQAIDQGEYELAIKIQNRIAASNATIRWNQNDLYRVLQGLLKSKDYARAIPWMESHIESFDEPRHAIQVLLLKICLHDQSSCKPLTYMQGLNPAFLSPEQMQLLKQLASLAKQQISSGVIEILGFMDPARRDLFRRTEQCREQRMLRCNIIYRVHEPCLASTERG